MDKEHLLRRDFSGLYSEIDLASLLNKIAGKIRNYLGCEESSIFLYDARKEELSFETATGKRGEALKKIVLRVGEGAVGWIAEHQEPLIINDCSTDPRFTSKTDKKTDFITRSILGVPVRLGDKLLGVMEAVNKIDGQFDDNDKEMLGHMSLYVAIPLQNAMLFRKVTQETREKDRLLELAKMISYSINQDEVFAKLKEIICDIISPLEINVIVKTREKSRLHRLMSNLSETVEIPVVSMAAETTIDRQTAVFPLKARDRRLGVLEIKMKKKIPGEAVSLIRGLAAFVAILIEKLDMQERMIEKEKIEKELQIAREIQQSFLLNEPIPLEGLDTAYVNIPSSEVGGDYYDIIKLNENETIFTINDISGHGIPASLLMSIFRTNFVYRIKKDKNLVTTISHLNNLIADTTPTNLFVTSFTCRLDMETGTVGYLNAGHNPPFVLRGDEIIKLEEGGLPVGVFPETPYNVVDCRLEPGDLLVMYTDGIVEAENPEGRQYSLERFIDFMKAWGGCGAEEIKKTFIDELMRFTEDTHFEDDVTFIIIKYK